MKYAQKTNVGGEWLKNSELTNGTLVTLASETKEIPSTFEDGKMQNVAKIKVKGFDGLKNVRLNWTTISALIEAFGDESNNWVGKVLTAHTEKIQVAGKRVTVLYLVPEGFEVTEDSEGYVKVLRKEVVKTEVPVAEDSKPEDLPF